jgi:hypothetical protein
MSAGIIFIENSQSFAECEGKPKRGSKQMENREKVTWRIWQSEGMGRCLLIGGLLFYVPLINLLLLGYYGQWAKRLILGQGMELPEWSDGRGLLGELGRVIIPALVWLALPLLLAGLLCWGLAGLLDFLYLGFFARTLAWVPVALVAVLAPPAMVLALIRLYRRDSLRDSLDVPGVLHLTIRHLKGCLFPLFQFYGLLAVGWPVIGFAAFLGVLPLLAQLILVLRGADGDLHSATN